MSFLTTRSQGKVDIFALAEEKVPLPLLIYAFCCAPLACWQMWFFSNLPNYYGQHIFIYPTILFMCWAWLRNMWTLGEVWQLLRYAAPWLLLLFCLQALAGWQSAQQYAPEEAAHRVVAELLKLAFQLPFVLFLALLGRVLMADKRAYRYILAGVLFSFAVLVFLCAIQGIYIYTYKSRNIIALWLNDVTRQTMLLVSPYLEARWPSIIYDFYKEGSYALTTRRINGLFEEASALCVMLGVFFVPLAFGFLAFNRRKIRMLGWIMLALCLEIAVFCQAITGVVLAALTILTLLFVVLPKLSKKGRLSLLFLLVFLFGAAAFAFKDVHGYLNKHTKERSPRAVITLDTLDMIAEHPLAGVGRGWFAPHQHEGKRYLKRLDDIELATWKEQGIGRELSALPALVAQYGVPLITAVLFFIGTVWRRLQVLRQKRPSDFTRFMAQACSVWIIMGLVLSAGSFDIRNPLFCLPFFCFWAVAAKPEEGI